MVNLEESHNRGQGTIEYLVIIAVVVVLSLVVTGIVISQTGSGENVTKVSSEIKNKTGIGGISIVDAIAGSDGNGLLVLKNIGSDTLNIAGINVDGVDHTFSESLVFGGERVFRLEDIAVCDGTKKSYSIKIYFTTNTNLDKSANFETITLECTSSVVDTDNMVDEIPKGSFGNPWVITDCNGLQNMNQHLDGNYILGNDINCYFDTQLIGGLLYDGGAGFEPIGKEAYCQTPYDLDLDNQLYCSENEERCLSECEGDVWVDAQPFVGTLNGNNKLISNLFINRLWATSGVESAKLFSAGLFGYVTGEIYKVGLTDVNITGSGYTGGLVGRLEGKVVESYLSGSVVGYFNVGGLIGTISYGEVSKSYSEGSVIATADTAGGLAGNIYTGIVSNSYSTSSVRAPGQRVGGFSGTEAFSTVSNCYSTGRVSSDLSGAYDDVGGFIGGVYWGEISNSFWDKENSNQLESHGGSGVVGKTTAEMKTLSTFNQWNIVTSSTNLNSGYPYLGWQNSNNTNIWFIYN